MPYLIGDNYWLMEGITLQVLKVVLEWGKSWIFNVGVS